MNEGNNYNKISFKGKMLNPGFSIYLFEINVEEEKYFYLGMTGDNFYPSARSAIHRLSGHFEKIASSTQNQVKKAIEKQKIDLENTLITMHHFPITGFNKWTLTSNMSATSINEKKSSLEYVNYKDRQVEIKELEDTLIFHLKRKLNDNLMNKTKGKNLSVDDEFKPLVKDVLSIIKNEGCDE